MVQNNHDTITQESNMEVSLINSYLIKVNQMIYSKYPLLISLSILVRKFHSVSRPMDGDEILRLPVRRTQTGLAGVEREGEEIEIEKKGRTSPGRSGLLSNLRLGDLFSIEVTS